MIILPISMGAIMLLIGMGFLWQRPFTKTTLFLLFLFPLMAITLYWHWGNKNAWIHPSAPMLKNLPDANQIIQQLQQHLAQQPNSAEGWYLLGRLYASQQRFNEASNAFAKANVLQPNQINTLINYAESLFMQKSVNDQQIEGLLKQVLILDPQNDTAMNLLAINFYQQKKYDKAISIWETLTEKYPPDTDDGKALLKAIAEAQQKSQAKKNGVNY